MSSPELELRGVGLELGGGGLAHLPEVSEFGVKHGLSKDALTELEALIGASIHLTQKRVAVAVPATVANLGPGLEAFGMAVDIWDEFTLEYAEHFSLEVLGDNTEGVPRTEENLVVVGAACAFKSVGRPVPTLRFRCTHHIPFVQGLGATAASFVGGFLAGSVLCAEELAALPSKSSLSVRKSSFLDIVAPREDGSASPRASKSDEEHSSVHELLQTAIKQGWNPGNVCPAIYGALQIGIETPDGWRSHRVPIPSGIVCAIFVPDGTHEGKPLQSETVERKDAIFNLGRSALLINCFCTNDFEMFQKATEETLMQSHCASQFPFLLPVIHAACDAGAAGAVPCGYGPCVMALITGRSGDVLAQSASNQLEREIGRSMLQAAEEQGVQGRVLIAKPADVGAHVLSEKSELGSAESDGRIVYFQ
mmetsp:Transcript_56814/g.122847  ORF Transcript_56814/g.122847 Transcript_56814/m.122847 type:complete len:422 (-) Transcript_56814:145-1410(-)|eukprot:CAMPEP_0170609928 /NCGR_PEP_ID=MMETSP0224-20130122/22381_1 /TAXON_ID=285029 /ORGANISM="Togula jolla, Strain CCCM 725" /LENGTH=421 /DNA_ID=CAMNT_0010935257 /DNA_START=42 /DNA_END=1307 /DNA_ORIENTATION=+